MRATAAFNKLLDLEGVNVTDVTFGTDQVTVAVRLRRGRDDVGLAGELQEVIIVAVGGG